MASLRGTSRGFTLIELMIAVTISLLILAALVGIFLSTTRGNDEMAKASGMIESGRFAAQALESDLVHAGFWGGYIPQFDNIRSTAVPADEPTAVPDPCADYGTWDAAYRINLLGIAVQAYGALPGGMACDPMAATAQRAGTDVLLVRHLESCLPGENNCGALVNGRLYFQTPLCMAELSADSTRVLSATSSTVRLSGSFSSTDGAYVGMVLHTISGLGAGQYRLVTAYDGASRTATISPDWDTLPDGTTVFAFDYMLGAAAFPLTRRDCATAANRRRFMSNIYYISNVPNPDRAGEMIPTLVRSELDVSGGTLAQQRPVPLIEGVEQFRVELGIDDTMSRCAPPTPVDYNAAIALVDPSTCVADAAVPRNNTLPTNRGDGVPDRFVRCTTAAPCQAADLRNVVAVKLYMLVRSRDTTAGYTDTKTYCLGELDADGTCPANSLVAAANDAYKRHVFISSVRLNNIAGRRETP